MRRQGDDVGEGRGGASDPPRRGGAQHGSERREGAREPKRPSGGATVGQSAVQYGLATMPPRSERSERSVAEAGIIGVLDYGGLGMEGGYPVSQMANPKIGYLENMCYLLTTRRGCGIITGLARKAKGRLTHTHLKGTGAAFPYPLTQPRQFGNMIVSDRFHCWSQYDIRTEMC